MFTKSLLLQGNVSDSEKLQKRFAEEFDVMLLSLEALNQAVLDQEKPAFILLHHTIRVEQDLRSVRALYSISRPIPIFLISEQTQPELLIDLFNQGIIQQYLPATVTTNVLQKAVHRVVAPSLWSHSHKEQDAVEEVPLTTDYQLTVDLKATIKAKELEREKYQKIIDKLGDEYIFYSKDLNNNITFLSASASTILGKDENENYNRFFDQITRSEQNRKAYIYAKQTLKGEQAPVFELELLDQQQQIRFLEVSEIPILNEDGELIGIEGVAHDITKQKAALNQLQQHLDEQTSLSTIASLLNQSADFLQVCEQALQLIGAQVNAIHLSVVQYGVTLAKWHRIEDNTEDITLSEKEVFPPSVNQEKERCLDDMKKVSSALQNWQSTHQVETAVFYPLLHHQQLKGYISVGFDLEGSLQRTPKTYFIQTSIHLLLQAYQRWKSHLELLSRVNYFRKIFEKAPFSIIAFVDTTEPVKVNQTLANLLGYSISELENCTIMDLFTRFTHPDDKAKELPLIAEAVDGKRNEYNLVKRLLHADGSIVWIRLDGAFLREETDGIHFNIFMIQDVTAQILSEQLKEAEQSKLQQILDALPISVSLKDEVGKYLFFNKLGLQYVGKEQEDVIGKRAREVFPNNLASVYESYDLEAKKRGGEVEWFEVKKGTTEGLKSLLVGKKNFIAKTGQELLLSFEVDVTTLKQAELDLENAINRLKQVQSNLEQSEKMSSLGILTAGVAHEINNPVNFIQGGVYILEDYLEPMIELLQEYSKLDKPLENSEHAPIITEISRVKEDLEFEEAIGFLRDSVNSIRLGSERTVEIVRVLRNFSRSDKQWSIGVNLHEALDSTLVLLKSKLKMRIELVKHYDDNLPAIACNSGQVNQVFMNLLSNAEQAITDEGIITITTGVVETNQVKIMISDTGTGMTPEVQQRIFEPFYTTKNIGIGTGLGLSISQSIIEKHGGTIEVESILGEGTNFIICLPIRQEMNEIP